MDLFRLGLRLSVASLLAMVTARAQGSLLYYRGIVNSASRMPAGLPGGAVAQGAIFSIAGARIGPAASPDLTVPPQTTLGGVSITVTQGSTTVAAIPVMVSPNRVDAIMPANAPLGGASVRLTYNNARSNPMPVQIVTSQFGLFSNNGLGIGPSAAQIVNADGTFTPVTLQTPVMPQQDIIVSGTGLGGVDPSVISVFVGGVAAAITQTGPVIGSPGQDQLQFTIPDGAPAGCWVPVYVRTSPTAVSNTVTVSISSDGSPCSEPNNPLSAALINGGNVGAYGTTRLTVRHDAGVVKPQDAITDRLDIYQANEVAGPANFNPIFSIPPAGTCSAYTFAGDPLEADVLLPGMTPPTGVPLDAGAITVSSQSQTASAQAYANFGSGYQGNQLGVSVPSLPLNNKLFLDGALNLNVAGGADVGAFSADTVAPVPFTWSNRDQILTVTRANGLTLSWTGGNTGSIYALDGSGSYVFILGYAVDMPTNAGSAFVCYATLGAGSFTVPADVMANFPATRARGIQSRGAVYVAQGAVQGVSTAGLDVSALLGIFASGKTVNFQ